jgi:hypothetical protein
MSDILKQAYNEFGDFERALAWDDPKLVLLDEFGVRGTTGTCVDFLRRRVEFGNQDGHVYQIFTGFRGSGKSTELNRLAKQLRDSGTEVVYIDSLDYLNPAVPTNISQVLISLAAGVDKHLECVARNGLSRHARRFYERFAAFMQTEVHIEAATIGITDASSIELNLKSSPAFREKLAEFAAGRLPVLAQQCTGFIREALADLRRLRHHERVLIIFDSFEKLRGDREDIRRSVEEVFVQDVQFLRLPCDVIYTVPPWMAFLDFAPATGFQKPRTLPMVKVSQRNSRKDHAPGIAAMYEILSKRVTLEALWTHPRKVLLPLLRASGGYPRDLLHLAQELVLRMSLGQIVLPADDKAVAPLVKQVIAEAVNQFDTAICEEDLAVLVQIARDGTILRHSTEDIPRLGRLFDHHFILSYQNGEPWYDLHPLVRQTPKLKAALKAHERPADQPGA